MEQLTQEKMKRARRNLKIVYWLIGFCIAALVTDTVLLVLGKVEWMLVVAPLLSLVALVLTAVNDRRILRGEHPWGDF